ncbi:MAG: TIGR01777 family protein [Candidatus Caenarcaniphilales bacterium]|nr:TIGR01777 family protein [Candidatus Caenarcaniphilales bacterium]
MVEEIEFSQIIPCDAGYLYKWHNMPKALDRLIPPWEKVMVNKHPEKLENGSEVDIKLLLGPLGLRWNLEIHDVVEGKQFCDSQVSGPFSKWTHKHQMQELNNDNSLLVESVGFKMPIFHSLGSKHFAINKLKKLFKYRFQVITNDIKRHYRYKERTNMKILVVGASGLVGSALVDFLSSGGHQVISLGRSDENEVSWTVPEGDNPGEIKNKEKLEGLDAVVHLAGENIASKRWSDVQKQKIRDSRVKGTEFLVNELTKLENPPKTLICASAIGFYGDSEDSLFDEGSNSADDFLGRTCQEWEDATAAAKEKGIRVVNTRIGVVLDPRDGALAKMLPIFQIGGGGNLGHGKQWMSWVALDDVVGAIHHCIMNEDISGPVNLVAPEPVQNKEFTKILAKVLFRPALFPAPAFALKLALGEMADALLLSSTKVDSKILRETGYEFSYPTLESALRHMLGKSEKVTANV